MTAAAHGCESPQVSHPDNSCSLRIRISCSGQMTRFWMCLEARACDLLRELRFSRQFLRRYRDRCYGVAPAINSAHINFTVEQFEQFIQLETSLTGSISFQQSVDFIKIPLPDLGFEIPDIGSVGFFFGSSLVADLSNSLDANFTFGANASIPAGATATFVAAGDGNSSATGWKDSSFQLIPFRLNSGSLNTTAGLALSPFWTPKSPSEMTHCQARLAVSTPQLKANAVVLQNATANANPPRCIRGRGNLEIHTSTDGSFLPDIDTPILTIRNEVTTGDVGAATVAPTGTLLAAAVAVPTYDMQKIESFYSASGTLPTNINYTQMAQVTQIPTDIKGPVNAQVNGVGAVPLPGGLLLAAGVAVIVACF
ncbi:hypothetical protein B0H13DRAFT_2430368 [Mycena leptocephala]|nr:hypothetical protein B0H13DRAFT_2430368 [Mycena leptocephala]